MNAASVQLKCTLSDENTILLCGDASPDYLHELDSYVYIQLPHHGQLDDATAIFDELGGDAYKSSTLCPTIAVLEKRAAVLISWLIS